VVTKDYLVFWTVSPDIFFSPFMYSLFIILGYLIIPILYSSVAVSPINLLLIYKYISGHRFRSIPELVSIPTTDERSVTEMDIRGIFAQ